MMKSTDLIIVADWMIVTFTMKGGSRRAELSRKVLMMMKAAKLGWAGLGAGQEQARSRLGAKQEQGRSMSMAGAGE